MYLRICAASFLTLCLISRPSLGQVVQLPTFHSFSIGTTVLVPDSGAGFVGGVNRSRRGTITRGTPGLSALPGIAPLFRNRGFASEASSSGVHVTATVIDLDELDKKVLAEARAASRLGEHTGEFSRDERHALFLSSHTSRAPSATKAETARTHPTSVAEIRRQNREGDAQRDAQLRSLWERARQAEAAGRLGAARCGYQQLARQASGKVREAALARLTALHDLTQAKRETRGSRRTTR